MQMQTQRRPQWIKCQSISFSAFHFQRIKWMTFNFLAATANKINSWTFHHIHTALNPCAVHTVNSAHRWNQTHLHAKLLLPLATHPVISLARTHFSMAAAAAAEAAITYAAFVDEEEEAIFVYFLRSSIYCIQFSFLWQIVFAGRVFVQQKISFIVCEINLSRLSSRGECKKKNAGRFVRHIFIHFLRMKLVK